MLTGWMLYTMWAVLGLMGLDILAGLYKSVLSNSFNLTKLQGFLGSVLTNVLPLLVLAKLTAIDPTGWLIMVAYYLAGLGIVCKYVMDIKNKLF